MNNFMFVRIMKNEKIYDSRCECVVKCVCHNKPNDIIIRIICHSAKNMLIQTVKALVHIRVHEHPESMIESWSADMVLILQKYIISYEKSQNVLISYFYLAKIYIYLKLILCEEGNVRDGIQDRYCAKYYVILDFCGALVDNMVAGVRRYSKLRTTWHEIYESTLVADNRQICRHGQLQVIWRVIMELKCIDESGAHMDECLSRLKEGEDDGRSILFLYLQQYGAGYYRPNLRAWAWASYNAVNTTPFITARNDIPGNGLQEGSINFKLCEANSRDLNFARPASIPIRAAQSIITCWDVARKFHDTVPIGLLPMLKKTVCTADELPEEWIFTGEIIHYHSYIMCDGLYVSMQECTAERVAILDDKFEVMRGGFVVNILTETVIILILYAICLICCLILGILHSDTLNNINIDPTSLTSLLALVLALLLQLYISIRADDMTWADFLRGRMVCYTIDLPTLHKKDMSRLGFINYLTSNPHLAKEMLSGVGASYIDCQFEGKTKLNLSYNPWVSLLRGWPVIGETNSDGDGLTNDWYIYDQTKEIGTMICNTNTHIATFVDYNTYHCCVNHDKVAGPNDYLIYNGSGTHGEVIFS